MGIFDTFYDRKNTKSVKWDMLEPIFQTEDVIPMWVADMDFRAPDTVNEALIERAKHGIYGYTILDEPVKQSITNWLLKRHKWEINQEWLSFSPGVVTSLHIAIQALTNPNDKILIQTPVYTPFYNVIESHGREVVKNPLNYKDNYYTIDFEDFERKLQYGVKAFILCSPHNPVGRVWRREELAEIARLCLKYNVLIVSDEIHADLLYPGEIHVPIATISDEVAEQTITCMSVSKTFNLAGLQASYIITTNKEIRKKIDSHLSIQGHGMLNTMGTTALEAAYNYGEPWLEELRTVLQENKNYVTQMFIDNTNELKVTHSEGTYLLWINCKELNMDSKTLNSFMIEKAKVGLNAGISYGEEGEQFMRMNIACPKITLEKGVQRIVSAVSNH